MVSIVSRTNSVSTIPLWGTEESSGPVSIIPAVGWPSSWKRNVVVSYYFTDEAAVIPELGLQGPTGSFEIVIEKSVSLTNWLPVVNHNTSSDEKAFYRFRISR